jgi:hypothetical protein
MVPFRNILTNPHTASWSFRFTVIVIVSAVVVSTGTPSQATTRAAKSEAQIEIDRLFQLAVRRESRQEAIDGIATYIENGEIELGDQFYAVRKLEELAAPELKDYLLGIAKREIRFKNSDQLRWQALRAYWVTSLAETSTTAEEEKLLTQALQETVNYYVDGIDEPITGTSPPVVKTWAIDELCRRGNPKHLDQIVKSVNSYQSGERAQQKIAFCHQQMELLGKFDDRLAAFEHTLETIDLRSDVQLVSWVLDEVFALKPNNLNEILAAYLLRFKNIFNIYSVDGSARRAFFMLRKRNWTDEQFKERGIDVRKYN